jgi:hypothetical protein
VNFRRRDASRSAIVLPMVLAIAACAPTGLASPASSPGAPSAAVSESVAPSRSTPDPSGSARPPMPALTVDADLLKVLPAEVDGAPLEPDPTTASEIAADPALAASAEAIAVALAITPGTSTSGDDLAIVSVIRLRPGVFSDAWFGGWRTAYDQAACEVAGGVRDASAASTIAGRDVFAGSCAGDARTFHLRLADPTLIVSITAAGPRRFGELVIGGLGQ